MATYSFLNVAAALIGPGGNINLGNGAAVADEGITIERTDDKNTMVTGADGNVMHSLHAASAGTIMVRLLKTSPVNAQLSQLYGLQTSSSVLHGQNTITIRDTARGDIITAQQCAFKRYPSVPYGKDAGLIEWMFDAGRIDGFLGAG